MSQVYAFVRQSGGDIKIQSELGAGTTITLFFPRVNAAEKPAEQPKVDRLPAQDRKAKVVLVVEDDDEVRHLTSEMLHDIGHVPLLARTSEEALGLLSAHGRIDILMTDIVLPGEGGVSLAEKVRRLYPSMKILFVTALLEFTNSAERAVLKKPYDKDELVVAFSQLYEGTITRDRAAR